MGSRFITALGLLLCIILAGSGKLFAQRNDFAQIDFGKADSMAHLYPLYSLQDIRGLATRLTLPLKTDVEKFRAIYLWTCLNIESDYQLSLASKNKRNIRNPEEHKRWNKKLNDIFFESLLKHHRTVCTGYAYVVRELALHAGLSCVMIDGYGRTSQSNVGGKGIPNHTWNAVKLNNKWYLCDATWSSGAIEPMQKRFVKRYDDTYFLLAPSQFVRNHYPLDTSWILLKQKPTLPSFLNRPLVYGNFFQYGIGRLFPETFAITVGKGRPVSFELNENTGCDIRKIELQINTGGDLRSFFPSLQQNECGAFIEHVFMNRGTHVVHVLLNDGYAFTYSVRVI